MIERKWRDFYGTPYNKSALFDGPVSISVGGLDRILSHRTAPADQKILCSQMELLYLAARRRAAAASISL